MGTLYSTVCMWSVNLHPHIVYMNVLLSWTVAGHIISGVFSVMWLGCFVVVSS